MRHYLCSLYNTMTLAVVRGHVHMTKAYGRSLIAKVPPTYYSPVVGNRYSTEGYLFRPKKRPSRKKRRREREREKE